MANQPNMNQLAKDLGNMAVNGKVANAIQPVKHSNPKDDGDKKQDEAQKKINESLWKARLASVKCTDNKCKYCQSEHKGMCKLHHVIYAAQCSVCFKMQLGYSMQPLRDYLEQHQYAWDGYMTPSYENFPYGQHRRDHCNNKDAKLIFHVLEYDVYYLPEARSNDKMKYWFEQNNYYLFNKRVNETTNLYAQKMCPALPHEQLELLEVVPTTPAKLATINRVLHIAFDVDADPVFREYAEELRNIASAVPVNPARIEPPAEVKREIKKED